MLLLGTPRGKTRRDENEKERKREREITSVFAKFNFRRNNLEINDAFVF